MRNKLLRLYYEGVERFSAMWFLLLAVVPLLTIDRQLKNFYMPHAKSNKQVAIELFTRISQHGRRRASYRNMSMPVSSQSNVWAGATYAAYLSDYWYDGRENLKEKLPVKIKLLLYFADLASRHGYFLNAWSVYQFLEINEKKSVRLLARIGLLDVAILVAQWSNELDECYRKGIWFDPDSVEGFSDPLSYLFSICDDAYVQKIYRNTVNDAPNTSQVYEMMGEYYSMTARHREALTLFRKACSINTSLETAKMYWQNTEFLLGELTIDENSNNSLVLAEMVSVKELCDKFQWPCHTVNKNESLSLSFSTNISKQSMIRSLQLEFKEDYLVELYDVMPLGSGMLLCSYDNKYRLVQDSKHLGMKHIKLFSPELIANDSRVGLVKRANQPTKRKSVYFVPGNGWNYYHWIVETVPLLGSYIKLGLLEKRVPLAFQFPLKKWHLETLELLGLGDAELEPFLGNTINYEHVYLQTFNSRELVPSPSSIRFIRSSLARPKEAKPGKKVYLTRKGVAATRSMKGRKKIDKFLEQQGYVKLDPAKMSLKKQIEFFSDVEAIAAEGGAALTNMLFCPKGTKVVVFSGDRAWAETFSAIGSCLEHKVEVFLGDTHPIPNPYYLWTAFDIAINDLHEME